MIQLLAQAFAPVDQEYLLVARHLQALSFAVHIPIVCFGMAFPALVAAMEWWSLRTGDLLHRSIAKRWRRIMITLFTVGVITGFVGAWIAGACGVIGLGLLTVAEAGWAHALGVVALLAVIPAAVAAAIPEPHQSPMGGST